MDVITQIIIWTSPVMFGVTVWLVKDYLDDLKSELKTTGSKVSNVHAKQIEDRVILRNVEKKVDEQGVVINSILITGNKIDQKTLDYSSLEKTVNNIDQRLKDQELSHGRILVVLKKVIEVISPNKKSSNF